MKFSVLNFFRSKKAQSKEEDVRAPVPGEQPFVRHSRFRSSVRHKKKSAKLAALCVDSVTAVASATQQTNPRPVESAPAGASQRRSRSCHQLRRNDPRRQTQALHLFQQPKVVGEES